MKTIRYTMKVKEVGDSNGRAWHESITSEVEDNITPEMDAKALIDYFNKTVHHDGEKRREFISLEVRK